MTEKPMIKIGKYQSVFVPQESSDNEEDSIRLFLSYDKGVHDYEVHAWKGFVTGDDHDKFMIREYLNKIYSKGRVAKFDEYDDIDDFISFVVKYDFSTWALYNRMNPTPIEFDDWKMLHVRLLVDPTFYRHMEYVFVLDDMIKRIVIDLKTCKISGDVEWKRLIPVFINNPMVSVEDAFDESTQIDFDDEMLINNTINMWRTEQSRNAFWN